MEPPAGKDGNGIESRLDPRRGLAALGFPETSEPTRVAGGWDTLLWRFATPDGREHALRVHVLPERKQMAARERIALDACAAAELPAPRVEAVGECEGLPALVLSWCPGATVLSLVERRPWTIARLGRAFGRAQARVHRVKPPGALLPGAPASWLGRVPQRYRDLADHALSLGLSTHALIHLDFHPLNLISDGHRVVGIIDWAGAAAGDPRADLARTVATLLAAPAPPGPLRALLNLARSRLLRAWRAGYEEVAGSLPDYRPLLAWAGATLLEEMERVRGRPHVWETERDIEAVARRVERWAREAGAR